MELKKEEKPLGQLSNPTIKQGKKKTYTYGYWLAEPVIHRIGSIGVSVEVRGLVVHEERRVFKSKTAALRWIRTFGEPSQLELNVKSEREVYSGV